MLRGNATCLKGLLNASKNGGFGGSGSEPGDDLTVPGNSGPGQCQSRLQVPKADVA